ncbi:uncharacterized protein LOC62_05G007280 [Vanrija pseudolonga]|uniref:Uncharacterized protein n=1 Tax=Vanrija pseudolonga TaxID=143232 RepID=A0AAF1BKA4_9TREE|nr:hypothetical protein LOC62_05G007280 [Vanrija pseudolonga]
MSEQLERIESHIKPRKGPTPDAKIQTSLRDLRGKLESIEDQVSEVSKEESVNQLADQLDRIEDLVQQHNDPPPELGTQRAVNQLRQLVERIEAHVQSRNVPPSEVNTRETTNQLREQLDRIEHVDRLIATRSAYGMNSFATNVHQHLVPLRAIPSGTPPSIPLASTGRIVENFPISTSDIHTKDKDIILALLPEFDLPPFDKDEMNRLLLAMFIGVGGLYYATYMNPS